MGLWSALHPFGIHKLSKLVYLYHRGLFIIKIVSQAVIPVQTCTTTPAKHQEPCYIPGIYIVKLYNIIVLYTAICHDSHVNSDRVNGRLKTTHETEWYIHYTSLWVKWD